MGYLKKQAPLPKKIREGFRRAKMGIGTESADMSVGFSGGFDLVQRTKATA
jgi:hypothetical protein